MNAQPLLPSALVVPALYCMHLIRHILKRGCSLCSGLWVEPFLSDRKVKTTRKKNKVWMFFQAYHVQKHNVHHRMPKACAMRNPALCETPSRSTVNGNAATCSPSFSAHTLGRELIYAHTPRGPRALFCAHWMAESSSLRKP